MYCFLEKGCVAKLLPSCSATSFPGAYYATHIFEGDLFEGDLFEGDLMAVKPKQLFPRAVARFVDCTLAGESPGNLAMVDNWRWCHSSNRFSFLIEESCPERLGSWRRTVWQMEVGHDMSRMTDAINPL